MYKYVFHLFQVTVTIAEKHWIHKIILRILWYVEQRWGLIAWCVATHQVMFEIDLCYNENMEDITIITSTQRHRKNEFRLAIFFSSMLLILSRMLLNRIYASPSSASQIRNGKFDANVVYLGWTNLTKALPLIVNWMFDWRSASGCYL